MGFFSKKREEFIREKELKKIKKEYPFYFNKYIFSILSSDIFKQLPFDYQNKVWIQLNQLLQNDVSDLEVCFIHYYDFFTDPLWRENKNLLDYLDILLDYPAYPLYMDQLIMKWHNGTCDIDLVFYTRLEAKLWSIVPDFYTNFYERILLNQDLRKLNYIDVFLNGLVNTNLDRNLILYYSYSLLEQYPIEIAIYLINQLFLCSTNTHIKVIIHLLQDKKVWDSGHMLEMIDQILATPELGLNELNFMITHKLEYVEMSFDEASRMYHEQAMKLLDESIEMCSSTRVRVPVYKKRF